ncbi:hypothetical protein [Sorangium sp. So ce1000]|uniref:hypothetical protein n=1 Tax=Sorangium sp. So ce1000 TaxID=3133325 RepID=UPI003F61FFEA
MLNAEEQVRVMKGFDRQSAVDERDYSLAAEALHRIADAVLARAKADGNDDVTLSRRRTDDLANAHHELPSAAFHIRDGSREWAWFMSVGRVVPEPSNRDPEKEWCIWYGHNGVAYVPKLITDDLVQALAERLAPFLSKAPS